MYQPHPTQPYPTSNPGFISPPASGSDPYRSSPIPMNARSPYTSALSPPPQSGFGAGVMPMPVPPNPNGQRYHQYASRSGSARYTPSPSSPYPNPANSPNPNPKQGYPQLPIPPQQTPQQKYKGTLAPGTIIKVGEAQVRIERYLSEGGYAHVYLTTSDRPVYPPQSASKGEGATGSKGRWGEQGYSQHCLKRIAFEDEKVWADVRREIEVMKALPSNPHLTQYLASAHSRLPSGGYEVFILMEFCSGGGIIDLLNKRLRDRLKEIEILNIFTDVCEAVAAMHHLRQPLLHRDLKIENVLSTPSGQSPSPQRPTPLIFKLCDFGSTTFPSSHPPQNKLEAESLALDLNKHTTLQYRSPEMVEPMLGWAVGLPSDVWALGVLLYKLCYYTTPFEEHGTLAIVNAKYTFPQYPVYSPKIQHLIASMLVDHPARRPSVFEVLRTAHEMSGTRPKIDYPMPSRSFPLNPSQQPSKPKSSSTNLLDFTSPSPSSPAPASQPDIASTVQPQRRGRPAREQGPNPASSASVGLPPMPQTHSLPVSAKAAQPARPKMQVTGEQKRNTARTETGRKETEKEIEKQPSTDAFGLPANSSSRSPASASQNGFGDAFSIPQPRGVAGISERFGGAAAARSGTANAGFSDSFTAKPSSATTTKPMPRVSSPEAMVSSNTSRQASTSTEPDGDISFETRFPSVDTLNSSADAFTPIISPPGTVISPPNLISPITSPQPPSKPLLQAKASMMGHLTGEMANKHLNPSLRSEGGPQPRSTQVTGTAFKGDSAVTPAGKASEPGREEYFSLESKENSGKAEQAVSPPDLMTGDAYSSMTGSRQNSTVPSIALQDTTTPPAPVSTESSRPVQTSRHSRPELPTLDTVNAASGDSTAGNLVSRTRSSPQKMQSKREDDDSSDEDLGPESASGMHIRQPSPVRRQGGIPSSSSFSDRKAAFESSNSLGRSQNKSPSKQSSAPTTLPKPPVGNLRQLSSDRIRPQSMFIPNSASRPLISPASETPQSADSGPSRPSHTRKGSVKDILTKYEALQSPSAATAERKSSSDGTFSLPPTSIDVPKPAATNGVSRKPSVASKPQSLRKPIAETNPAQTRSISPEKRQSANPPKMENMPNPIRPKPALAEKPVLAQRPSRHGDMPVAAGWSKSSSGRSFPVSKPATSSDTPPLKSATPLKEVQQDSTPNKGARSGSGSPEKQQSVGSLIARWNQTK